MNKTEIEQLCKKRPNDRYVSFIDNVRHTCSLYVLYNKSKREIALNIDKNDKKHLYLFPNEYSGSLFIEANHDMKKYVPCKWELTFFIETAIPRLKTENVEGAFIFPTPADWGFNATFDKVVEDVNRESCQLIDISMIKRLLDYLDDNLEIGCKHDYTLTKLYSYNSRWSEDEEFCEMQDMEGERFQILFKEEGCVINGVHNGYKDADKSILTEGLPEVYQEFLFGEPVVSYGTNFCIWTDGRGKWQYNETGEADGKEELLYILDGNPITYKQWAEEYFEVEGIPLDIIEQIYRGETLTESMVMAVNPEMENWEQLISDLEEINYTFDFSRR